MVAVVAMAAQGTGSAQNSAVARAWSAVSVGLILLHAQDRTPRARGPFVFSFDPSADEAVLLLCNMTLRTLRS